MGASLCTGPVPLSYRYNSSFKTKKAALQRPSWLQQMVQTPSIGLRHLSSNINRKLMFYKARIRVCGWPSRLGLAVLCSSQGLAEPATWPINLPRDLFSTVNPQELALQSWVIYPVTQRYKDSDTDFFLQDFVLMTFYAYCASTTSEQPKPCVKSYTHRVFES